MYTKILLPFLLLLSNIFSSYAQNPDREGEIRKITRLNISDVKLNYLKDSTHPFYVYFMIFHLDAKTNRPIIQKTADYPFGSFDITASTLKKFEAIDIKWNIIIPELSKQDTIILPIIVSRDPDKKREKSCIPIEQNIEIMNQCLNKVRIGTGFKFMEPLYYFEFGFLH